MNYCGILLAAVVWCQLSAVNSNDPAQSGDEHNAVVQSINTFSNSLYQVLSEKPGNLVVSPFSVEAVLAMLLVGLRGDTAQHLSAALHLPRERSKVEQGFSTLLGTLKNSENVTLEIANRIYIHNEFKVKDEFLRSTEQSFKSAAELVDIENNTEAVRIAINTWAAEKTHNKIQDFLAPGALKPNDVMVMLNAIYFKGFWENSFEKKSTRDGLFHLSSNASKNVPMMNLTAHLMLGELKDRRISILKLPYQGRAYSMLILLPDDIDGLRELETGLNTLDFSTIPRNLALTEVVLTLPRFKILSSINLEAPLQKLGMAELFNGGDFSGISDKPLAVSKVIQKAFIKVDEEGTEAAAVTELNLFVRTSKEVRPRREFTADHPFMYMIVEEQKGTVLFMGRVAEPTE